MTKVLMTGATGYLGASIARHLQEREHSVSVIARQTSDLALVKSMTENLDLLFHDGSSQGMVNLLEQTSPDVVIHLASNFLSQHSTDTIAGLLESNVLFGTQLIDAMTKVGAKKLINVESSWQYYQDRNSSSCLYAATKTAFGEILNFYKESEQVSIIDLVIFDTYGPGDPRGKLISSFPNFVKSGKRIGLSPGDQKLDLVFIDDLVLAFSLAVNQLEFGKVKPGERRRYAINTKKPRRLKEIAALFETLSGKKLNFVWGEKDYRDREVMTPWTGGEWIEEWEPKVTLEEGFKKIVEYERL